MELTRTHKWSIALLVIAFTGLGVFDLFLATNGVEGDTISALLYEASLRASAVAFFSGVVVGHLFIPIRLPISRVVIWSIILTGMGAVTALGWVINNPPWWGALALFLGVGVGGIVWSNQGKDGE